MRFRKIQVLAVVTFWSAYLFGGHRHGPPFIRRLSRRLSGRFTAWQSLILTLLGLYVARNFGKLIGLECPEPLANLYTRSFFRATWISTALDAGFWSAMRIRRPWLRDLASIVFSLYYLIAAEQADEKVRKVRGTLTVDHLRVSWNKSRTPYLAALGRLLRPKFTRYPPRAIRIARPRQSSYTDPVNAWLYFDGPISALKDQRNIVLDVPGGGFVAMNPRTGDDKLLAWAAKTGVPVLSLDYRKAPEYPYPYALNECYDVYHTLVASRGRCIGLSGHRSPKVIVTGDSAGGNLATGMVLMILESGRTGSRRVKGEITLPIPAALILIYPSLDMNIGSWMTEEQMALIKDRRFRKTNQNVLRRKSEDYTNLTPGTPHPSDDEDDGSASPPSSGPGEKQQQQQQGKGVERKGTTGQLTAAAAAAPVVANQTIAQQTKAVIGGKPQALKTRLAMSSMISYFNDRILTPEMMRAMIILYVGPHHRPDFSTDYLLCPLLAPESLLADFPPTFFQTGERDPLVDDTVIFAGRIRRAKYARWMERRELGLLHRPGRRGQQRVDWKSTFDENDHVQVALIPGISHGFLQFAGIFPEAWKCIFRCARWMNEIFHRLDHHPAEPESLSSSRSHHRQQQVAATTNRQAGAGGGGDDEDGHLVGSKQNHRRRWHHQWTCTESSGDDDRPLEMSIFKKPPLPCPPNNDGILKDVVHRDGNGDVQGDENGNKNGPLRRLTDSTSSVMTIKGINATSHRDDHFSNKTAPDDDDVTDVYHEDDLDEKHEEQDQHTSRRRRRRKRSGIDQKDNANKGKIDDEDDDDDDDDEMIKDGEVSRRNISSVSLASEDDLLGRRMNGLTGGLMGLTTTATTTTTTSNTTTAAAAVATTTTTTTIPIPLPFPASSSPLVSLPTVAGDDTAGGGGSGSKYY